MSIQSKACITCLCGAVHEDGSLLDEELPRDGGLCHCSSCRHVTGGLVYSVVRIHSQPSEGSLANCRAYATSEKITRWFCKTCGSHCFAQFPQDNTWRACSGVVEQSPESKERGDSWPSDVLKVSAHEFLRDTRDYNLASWLHTLGDRKIPCYEEDVDEPPLSKQQVLNHQKAPAATKDETLDASCHCGNVSLSILRPDWDLSKHERFIPPEGKGNYRAGFCACRSCRLAFGGSSLASWIFVPEDRILDSDGKQVQFDLQGTSLSTVEHFSTTRVMRSFCKTCGATVFFWAKDRTEVVDIAAGLLRAPEGSMASSWLWWRPNISYHEEATDRQIIDAYLARKT